jgi:hypothetical protein
MQLDKKTTPLNTLLHHTFTYASHQPTSKETQIPVKKKHANSLRYGGYVKLSPVLPVPTEVHNSRYLKPRQANSLSGPIPFHAIPDFGSLPSQEDQR